jgi:hypothetical protein
MRCKCGETDPDKFHKNQFSCKSCQKAKTEAWRKVNPEISREISLRSYLKNRERKKEQSRVWSRGHPGYYANKQKDYQRKLKTEAYEAYGGFLCACCGETREVFLCLDHINNDGCTHRKAVGSPSNLYRWLKKNEYPPIMQVLCYNCNNAKKYGVCPHQLET